MIAFVVNCPVSTFAGIFSDNGYKSLQWNFKFQKEYSFRKPQLQKTGQRACSKFKKSSKPHEISGNRHTNKQDLNKCFLGTNSNIYRLFFFTFTHKYFSQNPKKKHAASFQFSTPK
jgi:hypothetical protein